ncbi:MAG: NAD(+)/NADH kinase [Planctomycetes bacterium]|nr:NAD(+)/NADH kinase [Planctomycetota bacterium]
MPRALVLVNPAAGRGLARASGGRVAGVLAGAGWEVETVSTRRPLDAEVLERVNGGYDLVLPVGGDGTLNEVLRHWSGPEQAIPLAPVPAGSGNSLALDLGIRTPEEAARAVLSGRRRSLDGIRLTLDGGRVLRSINIVGWGAAARINARAEQHRWARGRRYDVASVLELLAPRLRPACARVNGERDDRVLLGVASITQHSGRGMRLAPNAVLDDGLFDVVTIRRGFRPRLLGLLAAVQTGAHAGSSLVELGQARTLSLELEDDAGLVVDGEWIAASTAQLEIVPGLCELWC